MEVNMSEELLTVTRNSQERWHKILDDLREDNDNLKAALNEIAIMNEANDLTHAKQLAIHALRGVI